MLDCIERWRVLHVELYCMLNCIACWIVLHVGLYFVWIHWEYMLESIAC